jgi:hypothetical protein
MATTAQNGTRYRELTLADKDPEVEHSGSKSDRFSVTFGVEGTNLLELQNMLTPRLAGVGVERISRSGLTMTLYGVEQGREGEVFHEVAAAIDDVNRARRAAFSDAERRRSASEAANAASDVRLEEVRESFQAARAADK